MSADLSVTADEVDSWGLPISDSKIHALMDGRERWTAAELVANYDPMRHFVRELLLVVLRTELITSETIWEIACRFMDLAFDCLRERGVEPDPRTVAAVETRRRWLRGEYDADFRRARHDAVVAAEEAELASEEAARKRRRLTELLLADPSKFADSTEAADLSVATEDAAVVALAAVTMVMDPYWSEEAAAEAASAIEVASNDNWYIDKDMVAIVREALGMPALVDD